MKWPKTGKCQINEHSVYYSGEDDDNRHSNGVGIILNKDINKAVSGFIPISDRISIVQLEAIPNKINIIAVYAPTAESDEELIEDFYEDLIKALKYTKDRDTNLIMGDFNAKIGEG